MYGGGKWETSGLEVSPWMGSLSPKNGQVLSDLSSLRRGVG